MGKRKRSSKPPQTPPLNAKTHKSRTKQIGNVERLENVIRKTPVLSAVQVHPHGFNVGLMDGMIRVDDGGVIGNPYAHICRVIHKRKLLGKPQLKALIWYVIAELHEAKERDQDNLTVDRAIASCAAALEEIAALPDEHFVNAASTNELTMMEPKL